MNRRDTIRSATLFAFAMALGDLAVLDAAGGELTVPLDKFDRVIFRYRGKQVAVATSSIYLALASVAESGQPAPATTHKE